MSFDTRVLSIIHSLYDAALEESLWPETLRSLTEFTHSQVGVFWTLDASDQPRLPTFIYINFDPAGTGEYLDHMAAQDPTVQYLVAHPDEPIVHDGLVISEREKDRHPYYDWHQRYSDTRFRIVGQVQPAPKMQAGIALHRTPAAGRYESVDIDLFTVLHQHLTRALTIGAKLGSLKAAQQCTTELLDRYAAAVVVLDDHGRVVYTNRKAEVLANSADGITFSRAGIAAYRKRDNDALKAFIVRALSRAGACGVLRIYRPSGKRPYVACVAPMSGRYPALSTLRPAVCVLINDPESEAKPPVRSLQSAFGFTDAEARLAALLAGGDELRAAAEKLGITYGTARVRLAHIFQKTHTSRQAELMKLLLTAFPAD